jgi:hypothetical protein
MVRAVAEQERRLALVVGALDVPEKDLVVAAVVAVGDAALEVRDRAADQRKTERTGVENPRLPRTYPRQIYVDTVTHDDVLLAYLLLGPERIVVGTDRPFDMGIVDPRGAGRKSRSERGGARRDTGRQRALVPAAIAVAAQTIPLRMA